MTHGTTLGEFAHMLNSEGWLENKMKCKIGVSETEITKSWEPGLSQYKTMRKKYLLYP